MEELDKSGPQEDSRPDYRLTRRELLFAAVASIVSGVGAGCRDSVEAYNSLGPDEKKKVAELGESATEKITNLIEDPGKPLDLPEYVEIGARYLYQSDEDDHNIFGPNHSDRDIRALMNCDYYIAILDILLNQVQTFYAPVTDEINKLDREIKMREELESETREQRIGLETHIRSLDSLIRSGHLLDGGSTKARSEIEKALKEKALGQLNQQSTKKDVKWPKPQTQMTEFPMGSGHYIPRYIPGPEVSVDLDKLRSGLTVYASGGASFLKTYSSEKAKWEYRRNQLLKDETIKDKISDDYSEDLSDYEDALDKRVQKAKARKDTDFQKQSIEPIHYLINDTFTIQRSAATAPQSHHDYLMWRYGKKIPDKLVKFGCYVSGNDIVKKNSFNVPVLFYINPNGSIDTQYPDNVTKRTLPVNADPKHKNAWSPPMP